MYVYFKLNSRCICFHNIIFIHLNSLQLKISKDYTWNQREMTSKGTPIQELIEFGINRMKYACGVVDALLKELKLASTAGKCKTIVVIDAFNAFTSNYTRIRDDNKMVVPPNKVTLAIPFLDITEDDWCNGAVVLTVDGSVRVRNLICIMQ